MRGEASSEPDGCATGEEPVADEEPTQFTSRQAAIAIDLIYGSLWYRLIFQIAPLDSTWAEDLTDTLAPPA